MCDTNIRIRKQSVKPLEVYVIFLIVSADTPSHTSNKSHGIRQEMRQVIYRDVGPQQIK